MQQFGVTPRVTLVCQKDKAAASGQEAQAVRAPWRFYGLRDYPFSSGGGT